MTFSFLQFPIISLAKLSWTVLTSDMPRYFPLTSGGMETPKESIAVRLKK